MNKISQNLLIIFSCWALTVTCETCWAATNTVAISEAGLHSTDKISFSIEPTEGMIVGVIGNKELYGDFSLMRVINDEGRISIYEGGYLRIVAPRHVPDPWLTENFEKG